MKIYEYTNIHGDLSEPAGHDDAPFVPFEIKNGASARPFCGQAATETKVHAPWVDSPPLNGVALRERQEG
ncbi:MAG: hypothetical protein FWG14_11455 [Peptococcaceae bacterium]|nr:hypothetical protein [Peptococcaceae bacterium]